MTQVLLALLTVIPLLKSLIESVKLSDRTKKILFGAIGIYILYRLYRWYQTDKASKTALGDDIGTAAVGLHTAIYSQAVDLWGFHIGNGDEEKCLEIARSIKQKSDYALISTKYKEIYGTDLTKDLEKILNADQIAAFNAAIGTGGTSGGTSGGVIVTKPAINPTTGQPAIKKGDIVFTKGNYNLRSTDPPYGVNNSTVNGEDWICYNNPYYATITDKDKNGKDVKLSGWWVVIQQPKSRYTFYPSYFVVSLNAVYKK